MKCSFDITKRCGHLIRCEKGGALAELAILVPFLIVMLAAVSEVGRFFQNYTTLTKSTRAAARYLSNHKLETAEFDRAQSLVVCGKLACGVSDPPLLTGLTKGNVCLESAGSPKVTSVTVRIPRDTSPCNPIPGAGAATPYVYQPIFDIGAILGTTFSLALPVAPSTTMYYAVE